jgi:hypothetical protein
MPSIQKPSSILVTAAAALVPIGPRRFRQLVDLETSQGKKALGLHYVGGRAALDHAKAMVVVERLRHERRKTGQLRQDHLGRFAEPCPVDPETGARLCIEEDCGAKVSGRGKLCEAHSAARASARAARKGLRRL